MSPRTVTRIIDLPRAIVWDGLVDPVLVEGWFDPERRFVDDPAVGVIERRDPELLRVRSEAFGDVAIAAESVPGGTRGASTRLTLTSGFDDPEGLLDRLEDLLRGHPVDWSATRSAERRDSSARSCGGA